MKHVMTTIAVVMAFVFTSAVAEANKGKMHGEHEQQPGKKGMKSSQMESSKMGETAVLNQIHHLNQKEIEMAKMAQKKSQSSEIKQYAQTLIRDHQQADQRVQELAKSQKVELSKYSPAGHEKAMSQKLQGLSGSEFDQAFLSMAKMDHKQSAEELRAAQEGIQDQQLKQFVQNDLIPTIQTHGEQVAKISVSSGEQRAGQVDQSESSDSMESSESIESSESTETEPTQ